MKKNTVPLERALSKLGLVSRSEARKLIVEGLVKINGKQIVNPFHEVIPEKVQVEINGEVKRTVAKRVIMLNKPKGLVTTQSDEKGRATVYSCLQDIKDHMPSVGRLDFATSGLLLFTNDNRLSSWITDPKNAITREYIAVVNGEMKEEMAYEMMNGILDNKEILIAKDVEILKVSKKESTFKISLIEGKNREIRRLAGHFKFDVTSLKRISFGGLQLGDLQPGKWRDVTYEEISTAFGPSVPMPKM